MAKSNGTTQSVKQSSGANMNGASRDTTGKTYAELPRVGTELNGFDPNSESSRLAAFVFTKMLEAGEKTGT